MEGLGYFASFLFISATVAQAVKTHRSGQVEDVSHLLLWQLMIGFALMIPYVLVTIGFDWVLLSSYILQALAWAVVMRYKYFPRKYK